MNQLGEKLATAMNQKENDIKTYTWKGSKRIVGGNVVQDEVKLVNASDAELQKFYDHCKSMLNNTDKTNPGRYTLLNIIKGQRQRCNTELFLRWLESNKKYPRFSYLQAIREALDSQQVDQSQWPEIVITSFTGGVPTEFQNITMDYLVSGCLDTLGLFDKKHITLSFITKLGLWFTPEELKEFNEDSKNEGKSKKDLVKERCGLRQSTEIIINPKAALNFKQFRAMVNLKTKKYSELTTDQLSTLRDKVLFKLEDEVRYHIRQWEERMRQLKEVAASRNLELK